MFVWPLISIIIFAPILGGFALSMVGGDKNIMERNSKYTLVFTTFITLVFSLFILIKMNSESSTIQLQERIDILPNFFINYVVGVDWVSISFIILTAFICFVIALFNTYYEGEKIKYFSVALLLLEGFIIGAFASQNLMLFFLFFETTLLPLFIMLGLRGSMDEKQSAFRFAISSMFSAMIILPALLIVVFRAGTGYIPDLATMEFSGYIIDFVWWALFVGFAIMLPVVPLNGWYLNVLNTSTIPNIILISTVISKLGLYALFRINVSIFPYVSYECTNIIILIASISILYGLISMIRSKYIVKKIGYLAMVTTSISLFTSAFLTNDGMVASIFYGLVSSLSITLLFVIYTIVEQRFGTLNIDEMNDVYKKMRRLTVAHLFVIVSIAGMPLTAGFSSLLLLIVTTFEYSLLHGIFIVAVLILLLCVVINMHYGSFWTLNVEKTENPLDRKTVIILSSICVLIVLIGLFPNVIIQPIEQVVWSVLVGFKGVGG